MRAQSAGSEFSGVAAQGVADTARQILNAVSFPRFITELINGVFKAMVDSNQQQLTSFVGLIRNIATTTEGFADAKVGPSGARDWLAERSPVRSWWPVLNPTRSASQSRATPKNAPSAMPRHGCNCGQGGDAERGGGRPSRRKTFYL